MNADSIRRIIKGAKPMIKQRKEPAIDADLTRPGDPIPRPFSGYRPRSRTLALVPADPAGDPGTDHCLADLEPAAGDCDLVRRGPCAVALLHLYGLREAALGVGLGGAVARDPRTPDRRPPAGRLGRLHQPQDRAQGVWLSTHLRPCRQDQSKPVSVGADDCHRGPAEGHPRPLGVPAPGLCLLSAPANLACRLSAGTRPGDRLSEQVCPSGAADRRPGGGLRSGPGPGGGRQLVRQQWIAQAIARSPRAAGASALAPAGQCRALRATHCDARGPGATAQVRGAFGQHGPTGRCCARRCSHLYDHPVWQNARGDSR